EGQVSTFINLDFGKKDLFRTFPSLDSLQIDSLFSDSLIQLASSWEKIHPSFTIEVYDNMYMTYYYNDSRSLTHLERERDTLFKAFSDELIKNAGVVPVILTDS